MTLSNLTAYVSIPENSAATPGLFDSRFNTLHGNVTQVNNDLSVVSTSVSNLSLVVSSVSGSGISGYRDVTLVRYGGAIGDGSTNDQPAFVSGNTSTATQAILYVPSASSVFKIGTALTISGTYQPIRGAVLRPASGVTITHNGAVIAGSYQLWDGTAGGFLDFSGNREMHYYDPRWFGVVGNNVADDTAALRFMFNSVPNRCQIRCPDNLKMKVSSTITIANRNGINLKGNWGFGTPTDTSDTGMQFTWSGATSPGAPLFMWDRCGEFEWERVVLDTSGLYGGTPGSGGIWMDMVSAGVGTGTKCHLRSVRINAPVGDTAYVGVYVAPTTQNNEEFHFFEDVVVQGVDQVQAFGYPFHNPTITLSVASGSTIATVAGSTSAILSTYSGLDVRIARGGTAGAASDGGVGPLVTTMASYISGDRFSLATSSKQTVTAQAFKIGRNKGTAFAIGGSFNAKDILFHRVAPLFMGYGLQSHGGSFKVNGFRCEQNEVDCAIDGNQAEASEILNWNTEDADQALVTSSQQPFAATGRFGGQRAGLGTGYFRLDSTQAAFGLSNALLPTPPSSSTTFNSTGATIFDLTIAASLRADVRNVETSGAWRHQSGLSQLHLEGHLVVDNWVDFQATDLNETHREHGERRHKYHNGVHDFTGPTAALSIRTVGTSVTSSNMTFNETLFFIGSSGASLAIRSGNTIHFFNSSSVSTVG